ncbi:MAG TPA: peptidase M48, partial [Natronosporangium sp.]|nr:peptidase M48 [Natronosporangium sp.]
RETFQRSEDPLFKLVRRVAGGADEVGEWIGTGAGRLREWLATAGRSAWEAAGGRRGDEPTDAASDAGRGR